MHSPALLLLLALSLTPCLNLRAQDPATVNSLPGAEKTPLTPAQIDDLLAPVALYPDALIAIILPASTFPTDIVLAARYLNSRQDSEGIDSQPWDESVKALARYPEVLKWMDENLAWTQQMGEAFVLQPAAVLTGTQRLRAAAIAAGNLKDTPEQNVVVEREIIRIEPAAREVIYVPVYDPMVVYRQRVVTVYEPSTFVSFSSGYRTGLWLSYSCDWNRNTVVYISKPHRQTVWLTRSSWAYPARDYPHYHRDWCADSTRVQSVRRDHDRRHDDRIVRPAANNFVQTRPGRDSGTRNPDRATETRAPGRASREDTATSQPRMPVVTPDRPSNNTGVVVNQPDRDTPRYSPGGRDRNQPSPNQRTGFVTAAKNNPNPPPPAASITGPGVPSSVVAANPSSRQLTLPAETPSVRHRQPDNNTGSRRTNPPATVALPQTTRAPAPQAAPEFKPDRAPKLSLKSAPAYAHESRSEARAERKAQEARQASTAQASVNLAPATGNAGNVAAEDSRNKRRDRRQEP
jgi:hypothetical protein